MTFFNQSISTPFVSLGATGEHTEGPVPMGREDAIDSGAAGKDDPVGRFKSRHPRRHLGRAVCLTVCILLISIYEIGICA